MATKPLKSTAPGAYAQALARLARRDHSVEELRRALLRAGHGEDEVEQALARLVAERYLDDSGFAARFARSRLAAHGLGRNRVRASLRARGVAPTTAEEGLREALAEVSEEQSLEAQARRYWRLRRSDPPQRRLRRLWALLLRRGFPAGLVADRLRRLWPRWKDALEGLEPSPEADE